MRGIPRLCFIGAVSAPLFIRVTPGDTGGLPTRGREVGYRVSGYLALLERAHQKESDAPLGRALRFVHRIAVREPRGSTGCAGLHAEHQRAPVADRDRLAERLVERLRTRCPPPTTTPSRRRPATATSRVTAASPSRRSRAGRSSTGSPSPPTPSLRAVVRPHRRPVGRQRWELHDPDRRSRDGERWHHHRWQHDRRLGGRLGREPARCAPAARREPGPGLELRQR